MKEFAITIIFNDTTTKVYTVNELTLIRALSKAHEHLVGMYQTGEISASEVTYVGVVESILSDVTSPASPDS